MSLLNIMVLYGGKSAEHEVSVHSAQTVCRILGEKKDKYNLYPVFIDKKGNWFLQNTCGEKQPEDVPVTPVISSQSNLMALDGSFSVRIDVVFPVLHGTNCEDGTMQGFLHTLNIPYVGCGVLASAVGMDKELSKILANKAGADILPYRIVSQGCEYDRKDLEKWSLETGLPLFVKPVRLGSSVGVRKVKDLSELHEAVAYALQFDKDVMIEKGVDHAREVFCAVCGEGETLRSSACGELRSIAGEFFDYQAKYITAGGCETEVPARLPEATLHAMRRDAENIFKALQGSGLARIDFLLDKDGKYYFSEINTLPGMSETSLFPQLFEASGEKYADILDELISLAQTVHAKQAELSLER